jgi:hypothetical protein
MRYHQGQRPLSDRHAHAQLTRFIPEEVAELFARRTTYADEEAHTADLGATRSGTRGAVEAFLAGLWD